MNNILITGGLGFIGSNLINYIINNTNDNVIIIDKLTYASNKFLIKNYKKNNRIKFIKCDICDKKIKKIFFKYKPTHVMHLAAKSHVDNSIKNPDEFVKTNIFGTYNLLKYGLDYYNSLSKNKQQTFRFLHVSTDEVYGDLKNSKDLFKETTPYDPSSPYSASKASSDHFVKAWHTTFNFPIIITNCSNNFGPYQHKEKLIPKTIFNAINNLKIPIYGSGSQIRDWLFVEDHVKALYLILLNGNIGESYNIGGNNEKSNIDIVTKICLILDDVLPKTKNGKKISYLNLIEHVEDRLGHDVRYAIDYSKLNKELNWKPSWDFLGNLKSTILWYLNFYKMN